LFYFDGEAEPALIKYSITLLYSVHKVISMMPHFFPTEAYYFMLHRQ